MLIRNYYVYEYRVNTTDRCCEICRKILHNVKTDCSEKEFNEQMNAYYQSEEMWNRIRERHDYDDMLLSFKPLKDKYWFTEEQIKWLSKYERQ